MSFELLFLVFLSIALNSVEAILTETDIKVEIFERWRGDFKRNFTTKADEVKAKENLVRNLREIDLHNARFKAGLETYSRGYLIENLFKYRT